MSLAARGQVAVTCWQKVGGGVQIIFMRALMTGILSLALLPLSPLSQGARPSLYRTAHWFDGQSLELGAAYSVDGRLTFREPARVDRAIDLAGSWSPSLWRSPQPQHHRLGARRDRRAKSERHRQEQSLTACFT